MARKELNPLQQKLIDEYKPKLSRLIEIRKSTTLKLHPTPILREEIEKDGAMIPFRFRYYQYIGVSHLVLLDRMILGDGTGLGKTVQVLGALAYLWAKKPELKAIVVTPKSALWQWASETTRFLTGVRPIVAAGKPEERKKAYDDFANAPTGPGAEKVILIVNYKILVRDWDAGGFRPVNDKGKPDPKAPVVPGLLDAMTSKVPSLIVVFDEATAFKNPKSKTWQIASFLSAKATRCYGLTATLLKNNLIEGFAIYKVLLPRLFTNVTWFMDAFCKTHFQSVPGNRKIKVIDGYKNLDHFREMIDGFFIGRPKHVVSDELPKLSTKEIVCELSPVEISKYDEATTGLLELGDGEVKEYVKTKQMASLIYCQEIANSLHLIRYEMGTVVNDEKVAELSAKESTLIDLLEGELEDEKVIVYSRFEKFITRLSDVLKKAGIRSARITGKENDKARRDGQNAFQDMNSGVNVIFISDAGSESINLQSASAMVFMDAPWSYGNYLQLLGRPIRIGSIHKNVVVYHLIAVRPGKTPNQRRTIDHHVLDMLHTKKDLVDEVLGESAVGALDFEKEKSGAVELFDRMRREKNSV